jgi:hypothetical protein
VKTLGIDFDGSKTILLIVEVTADAGIVIGATEKIELEETRSAAAIRAFMEQARAFLAANPYDLVAIRSKPENGTMRAGAAALKMEAIFLAFVDKDVDFVSGQKINKITEVDAVKYAYQRNAYKAAVVAMTASIAGTLKKEGKAKKKT